jgi:hypothetical protein
LALNRVFLTTPLLHRAAHAQRVIFLPATLDFLRDPPFPRVRIVLKMFLLRHATAARRDTFLQAAANFHRDPQSLWVSSFGSLRRPAAICRPLCRFFVIPEDFPAASSVGTSRRSTSDSNSFGPCSLHSRLATVSSCYALMM